MLPRARTVNEVPNGTSQRPLDTPLVFWKTPVPSGRHDIWPSDHDQRGNPLTHRRVLLVVAAAQLLPALRAGWLRAAPLAPDNTCGQPPLTVSTTVVSANAIVYDSQLHPIPSGSPSRAIFDQRSPALWRGVTAVGICPGEGRHQPGTLGPSGVKVRQVQSARGTKDYPCKRPHFCANQYLVHTTMIHR